MLKHIKKVALTVGMTLLVGLSVAFADDIEERGAGLPEEYTEDTNFRITGGLLSNWLKELSYVLDINQEDFNLSDSELILLVLSNMDAFDEAFEEFGSLFWDFFAYVSGSVEADVTFDTERAITGTARSYSRVMVHVFSIIDDELLSTYNDYTYVGASGVFSLEAPLSVADNVVVVLSIDIDEDIGQARINAIFASISSMDLEIRHALENRPNSLPGRPVLPNSSSNSLHPRELE